MYSFNLTLVALSGRCGFSINGFDDISFILSIQKLNKSQLLVSLVALLLLRYLEFYQQCNLMVAVFSEWCTTSVETQAPLF